MATKGKGAKFWLWDSLLPTPALVAVANVTSITPPVQTRDTIDVTTHDSAGDYREFISSLIVINYDPGSAGETLIRARFADGLLNSFAIDLKKPGSATKRRTSGTGIVTSFAPADVVIDDKMTATVTVKVSGPLVFADAP
jgi:predicted secreted protein